MKLLLLFLLLTPTVVWNPPKDSVVKGYNLYLKAGSATRVIKGIRKPTYTFNNLLYTVKYTTWVTAYNQVGESKPSNKVIFYRPTPKPTPRPK